MQDKSDTPANSQHPVRIEGDAYFILGRQEPDIPEDQRRACPQCAGTVGVASRWCPSCGYDLDAANFSRYHPTKLLMLSLVVNIILAGAVALLLR